jgi:hypothetical protein
MSTGAVFKLPESSEGKGESGVKLPPSSKPIAIPVPKPNSDDESGSWYDDDARE